MRSWWPEMRGAERRLVLVDAEPRGKSFSKRRPIIQAIGGPPVPVLPQSGVEES